VLERPTAGVDFGLQKGRGSGYETVQTQRSTGHDLVFECEVIVKAGALTGPFLQGPPGGRFLYIDIGTLAGQPQTPWTRRLKIPLTGITAKLLAAPALETRVAGCGVDGSPSCGTARPFAGWKASY